MTEITVTTVDPRSMIPSQSGRDGRNTSKSPTIRGKLLSVYQKEKEYATASLNPAIAKSNSPKNDLK